MDKQEPVAIKVYRGELCYKSQDDDQSFGMWCPITQDCLPFAEDTKFYTAPPKREWVGLTESEIVELAGGGITRDERMIARAIEAKLKEKNS